MPQLQGTAHTARFILQKFSSTVLSTGCVPLLPAPLPPPTAGYDCAEGTQLARGDGRKQKGWGAAKLPLHSTWGWCCLSLCSPHGSWHKSLSAAALQQQSTRPGGTSVQLRSLSSLPCPALPVGSAGTHRGDLVHSFIGL